MYSKQIRGFHPSYPTSPLLFFSWIPTMKRSRSIKILSSNKELMSFQIIFIKTEIEDFYKKKHISCQTLLLNLKQCQNTSKSPVADKLKQTISFISFLFFFCFNKWSLICVTPTVMYVFIVIDNVGNTSGPVLQRDKYIFVQKEREKVPTMRFKKV